MHLFFLHDDLHSFFETGLKRGFRTSIELLMRRFTLLLVFGLVLEVLLSFGLVVVLDLIIKDRFCFWLYIIISL